MSAFALCNAPWPKKSPTTETPKSIQVSVGSPHKRSTIKTVVLSECFSAHAGGLPHGKHHCVWSSSGGMHSHGAFAGSRCRSAEGAAPAAGQSAVRTVCASRASRPCSAQCKPGSWRGIANSITGASMLTAFCHVTCMACVQQRTSQLAKLMGKFGNRKRTGRRGSRQHVFLVTVVPRHACKGAKQLFTWRPWSRLVSLHWMLCCPMIPLTVSKLQKQLQPLYRNLCQYPEHLCSHLSGNTARCFMGSSAIICVLNTICFVLQVDGLTVQPAHGTNNLLVSTIRGGQATVQVCSAS